MSLFKVLILLVFALLLVAIAAPEPLRAIPLTSAPAGPQVCSGPYTLEPGETLALVATRCNLSVSEIVNVNPGITDMKNVPAGTTVVLPGPGRFPGGSDSTIPSTGGENNASSQAAPVVSYPPVNNQQPAAVAGNGTRYTVASGDTLSSIAVRYNTSLAAVLAANPGITNPNLIYPGQVIWIPSP